MTPAESMAAALDRANLTRTAIMAQAQAESDALDALVAWRRVDREDDASADTWTTLGALIEAADRLIDDADGIRTAVRTAQAIVRGDELPCGHRISEACEVCVPEVPR